MRYKIGDNVICIAKNGILPYGSIRFVFGYHTFNNMTHYNLTLGDNYYSPFAENDIRKLNLNCPEYYELGLDEVTKYYSYDDGGGHNITYLYGERLETDEEFEKRLNDEKEYIERVKAPELVQYQKLKEKFEKSSNK